MKLRLFLIAFCWLLVLAAPPLRDQFLTQVTLGHFYRGWVYGPFRSGPTFVETPPLPADLPRDARLQAVALEERENGAGKFGRGYDALIQQYPGEAWLLALRLKKAVGEMRSDRVGGELSDPFLDTNKAARIPSPERDAKQLNFKPNELEEVIALARRGQKLEPDNAFFDWMLVYFLMSGWRDREAWQVLEKAAKKTRFNDYEREWLKANIAAREWQLRRPLLMEEINYLSSSVSNSNRYRSWLREMGRIILWEANKAERRGDHAKALQIHADFARLMFLAARQAYEQISALVYYSMGALALRTDAKPAVLPILPEDDPHESEKYARLRAPYFARYARAHGRADLAEEMTALRLAMAREQDTRRNTFRRPDISVNCIPARPLRWAVILWWGAALSLMILPMLALWWALLGGLLHFSSVPKVPVEKRRVAWATILAAGTTALCWAIAFYCGAGWIWNSYLVSGGMEIPPDIYRHAATIFALLGILLPAPLADEMAKRLARERSARLPLRQQARDIMAGFQLSVLLRNGAIVLFVAAAMIWWGGCFYFIRNWKIFEVYPLWPQLAFFVAIALMWLPLFFVPAARKPAAARHLRLLHTTLGNLLVTFSVSYLLLLLISLPVRGTANAHIAQLIERGERAMLLQNARR